MSIIVGYVPSPEGVAALETAITEARKNQKLLVVVNSSRGDALVDRRYAQGDDIAAVADRLAAEGVEHLILQAADEHRAELIVIGLRKRTPVGKLIMGSTAQQILLEADCPILAVKAAPAH